MGTKWFRQRIKSIICKTVWVSQQKYSNFINANDNVEFDYALAA